MFVSFFFRSEATLNDHDNINDVSSDSGMRGEVLSLAVSFAVFAIYMKTLHPSIPGGDSGIQKTLYQTILLWDAFESVN